MDTELIAMLKTSLERTQAQRDEAMRPLQEKNDATCIWRIDDANENTWEGECGNSWIFDDGTPADNSMRFCPFCGKKLVVQEATPCT
jgi:hypothetical protein